METSNQAHRQFAKYHLHPGAIPFRDLECDDPSATSASAYGWMHCGSRDKPARGLRILVHQGKGDPVPFAYATDQELADAMGSHQGEPGWYMPPVTYSLEPARFEGTKSKGSVYFNKKLNHKSVHREAANVQDVSASLHDYDWDRHPEASLRFSNADEVWEAIKIRVKDLGWPAMNRAHSTGRGILAGYQYEPVPFYQRNRTTHKIETDANGAEIMRMGHKWYRLQIYIYHTLVRALSTDTSCLNLHQFYKIAGSVNEKSGRQVRVLREPEGSLYEFSMLYNLFASRIKASYLAGELDDYVSHGCWPAEWRACRNVVARKKPARRSDTNNVVSLAIQRAARSGKASTAAHCITADANESKAPFDLEMLGGIIASPRLRALILFARILEAEGRWCGDYRQKVLFLWAVTLSWIDPKNWRSEFLNQVSDVDNLGDRDFLRRVSTVVRRVSEFQAGETREWLGEPVDPRYKFSKATIRGPKWLKLSAEAFERYPFMLCFAPDEVQAATYQRRQTEKRQAEARIDRPQHTGLGRANYEASTRNVSAITKAHALRTKKLSLAKIAQEMGCSTSTVSTYLKLDPQAVSVASEAAQSARSAKVSGKTQLIRREAPRTAPAAVVEMLPPSSPVKLPTRFTDSEAVYWAHRMYLKDCIDIAEIAKTVHRPVSIVTGWLSAPEVLELKALLAA